MKTRLLLAAALVVLASGPSDAAASTETILLVRHGEKPPQGLGQLSCRGLNRALRLPAVLARDFGRPDAIFAPNPAVQKEDDGVAYAYVRPLATVEPTAITFGLPVDTRFGFEDVSGLEAALEVPAYRGATVLVGWEHKQIDLVARHLLARNGGDAASVPKWKGSDFDGIYVLRIVRDGDRVTATFERRRENLDGLPDTCPGG